ncbi:hypothetical protein O181_121007 [Austropuccinia psidii MF-1]|uniref:Zn(2)-C6 fungal-type domain-containing protein n=1 Tax=Austropuccinia psidii MF-1 TaxID=1389203 RepID=A0A9Q3KI39_9BASI|nr:hypothetical protein [Austropuccinia psidii MF-1]
MTTNACDACQKAHKKCSFVVRPLRPRGQRSSRPRCHCKESLVVNNDEAISEHKLTLGPQAGGQERFQTISPTPRQPTPGPSGTQWSEELFREPSRTKEQPIPGRSPSSQPPEDNTTREPEPEMAPTQCTEEPFGKSPLLFLHSSQLFLTFSSTISGSSRHSLLHNYH